MARSNKLTTTLTAFSVGSLLACASPALAAITSVSYDFGTDPGKTTFGDAGFTAVESTTGLVANVADGVQTNNSTANRDNIGFFRTFTGLGVNDTNNFTISTTVTMVALEADADDSNTRPAGIHLFADIADIQDTGIHVRLEQAGLGTDRIEISGGLDESTPLSATWNGGNLAEGDVLVFTVSGVFDTVADTFALSFTADNGTHSQTIDTTIASWSTITNASANPLRGGNYFGLSGRFDPTVNVEYDTFSVEVVPEPGSLALLGLGGLCLMRRRAIASRD